MTYEERCEIEIMSNYARLKMCNHTLPPRLQSLYGFVHDNAGRILNGDERPVLLKMFGENLADLERYLALQRLMSN